MNIVALFYATLITFVTGIIITNQSRIERLVAEISIHIDAYSIGHTAARIALGVAYLCIPVVLYRLRKAKMDDNTLYRQNNIRSIKRTLICLIGIILISKAI